MRSVLRIHSSTSRSKGALVRKRGKSLQNNGNCSQATPEPPRPTIRQREGSTIQMLENCDACSVTPSIIAKHLTADKEGIFHHHNGPLLHCVLASVGDSFGHQNNTISLSASRRRRSRIDEDLSEIRSAVARKAKANLPVLADSFPWLLTPSAGGGVDEDNNTMNTKNNTTLEADGSAAALPSSSQRSEPPFDAMVFATDSPSRWARHVRHILTVEVSRSALDQKEVGKEGIVATSESSAAAASLSHSQASSSHVHTVWADAFHAVANNGAWLSAQGLARAHTTLLAMVSEYVVLARSDPLRIMGGDTLSFGGSSASIRSAALDTRRKKRGSEHRGASSEGDNSKRSSSFRKPVGREAGVLEGNRSMILSSALSPQWLRKMRGYYIKMMRLDLYAELFRVCCEGEEGIAQSYATRLASSEDYSDAEHHKHKEVSKVSGRFQIVPSLIADDDHLSFFAVLNGRREALGSKATRWASVLTDSRWAATQLLKSAVLEDSIDAFIHNRLAPLFKMVANVAAFIHNDGNEDRRVRQLLSSFCQVDTMAATQQLSSQPPYCLMSRDACVVLTDVIEKALVGKIGITKGGSTPSILRSLSILFTLRHALAAAAERAVVDDAKSLIPPSLAPSLTPLLFSHADTKADAKGSSGTPSSSSPSGDEETNVSDAVLSMPASIARNVDRHVDYMASSAAHVVNVLTSLYASGAHKGGAVASYQTLLEWIAGEVKSCTPIGDWRCVGVLVDAVLPFMSVLEKADRHLPMEERRCTRLLGMITAPSGDKGDKDAARRVEKPLSAMMPRWRCGCGATNTLLANACWSCLANKRPQTCPSCSTVLSQATVENRMPCTACSADHPKTIALAEIKQWQCKACDAFSPTSSESCLSCSALNPISKKHSCTHCGHVTKGEVGEAMCSVCGQLNADALRQGVDSRLVLCGGCSRLYPMANHAACPHCRHPKETVPSRMMLLSHFNWVCGCGVQNSPLTHQCRGCKADMERGEGAESSMQQHALVVSPKDAVFKCPSCDAGPPAPRRGRLIPSLPSLIPFECKACDALHPRDLVMLSRRSMPCHACHAIVPAVPSATVLASETAQPTASSFSCGQCGSRLHTTSDTRFMPTFADLPWHCHSCGEQNMLHREDAESALRCAACDVDRVAPLLFSEYSAWDCSQCNTKRNYGFACRTCSGLHSSIVPAEVTLWRCEAPQCGAFNPSWRTSCAQCAHAKAKAREGGAADKEAATTLKYLPWKCSACAHFNSASSDTTECTACKKLTRPAAPWCPLCQSSHYTVACHTAPALDKDASSSLSTRSSHLEKALLAAAHQMNAADHGDHGKAFDAFGMNAYYKIFSGSAAGATEGAPYQSTSMDIAAVQREDSFAGSSIFAEDDHFDLPFRF